MEASFSRWTRAHAARASLLRAWHDTPAWARSQAAFMTAWAVLALSFLAALALVVQGEVERNARSPRGDIAMVTDVSPARDLWECAATARTLRRFDCSRELANAHPSTYSLVGGELVHVSLER